jgi:hypothetical protein
VRDGHVAEPTYTEPFDLLFLNPSSDYDDGVARADEMARHPSVTKSVTIRSHTPRVVRS